MISSMEKKPRSILVFSFSISISLGLVSFISCIAAQVLRTKKKDLRIDGTLCYLPESPAFGLGIAALVCLFIAHVVGNSIICRSCCSREKKNSFKGKGIPVLATSLHVISLISFGIAVILLSTATSMSKRQSYGKGWLNGECYVVKAGVYVGSAMLILVTISCTISSAVIILRKKIVVDQYEKSHHQSEGSPLEREREPKERETDV